MQECAPFAAALESEDGDLTYALLPPSGLGEKRNFSGSHLSNVKSVSGDNEEHRGSYDSQQFSKCGPQTSHVSITC